MELEGEIIGFVLVFIALSAAFYFFVVYGENNPVVENQTAQDTPAASANTTDVATQGEPVSINESTNETVPIEINQSLRFDNISELHWDHMPLTYRVMNNNSNCTVPGMNIMREAFEVIAQKTDYLVNFTEAGENQTADINVSCVDLPTILAELEDDEICEEISLDYRTIQFSGYEVLADTDYVTRLTLIGRNDTSNIYTLCYVHKNSATTNFSLSLISEARPTVASGVIVFGEKNIYTIDSQYQHCTNFPAKEVHDVLHLFGFGHSETPTFDDYYGWFFKDLRYFKDVMFPYTYCSYVTQLNENYIECLKYLYSNGEKGVGCAGVTFTD